jgi:hypothetical protein
MEVAGGYVKQMLPMKMEQIECFKTSAYNIRTPGNHPEENIQHTEHGESLKSKKGIRLPTELSELNCWYEYKLQSKNIRITLARSLLS